MLVLLLVLQRFGRRQWGWVSELNMENCTVSLLPVNPDGTLGGDEIDVNFYPEDKVHSSWTLVGRATTVVGANRDGEANSEVVEGECAEARCDGEGDSVVGGVSGGGSKGSQRIKGEFDQDVGSIEDDNGPSGTDTTGRDPSNAVDPAVAEAWRVYNQARDAYRITYGNIIKAHDLVLKVSWPETSRPEEWKIIGHAQALGQTDKFIRRHIPEVKYAKDLGHYSTQHIRGFLGLQPDGYAGTRTLRLIVMNRLRPIYDLDGEHFWKAFWECVACMRFIFCLRSFAHVAPRSSPVVGERDPPWRYQSQQPDVRHLRDQRPCGDSK
jgi:hypothetical protein